MQKKKGEEKDWNFPPRPNGINDFFDVPGLSVDGRILPGWSEGFWMVR